MSTDPNTWSFMLREGDHGEPVPPVQFLFDQPIPSLDWRQARAIYQQEAARLADALWDVLPGGVVDQLAAELLSRVAVRLKIGLEPTKKPGGCCGRHD